MAEISEQLLPAGEANERHFRLLMAVLEHIRAGGNIWQAVTYFALWSVRLAGFLPDLRLSRGIPRDRPKKCWSPPSRTLDRARVDQADRRRPAPLPAAPNRRTHRTQALHSLHTGILMTCTVVSGNGFSTEEVLVRSRLHHSGALRSRSRRRHHGARNLPARARAQALSRRLRAAQPPPRRRPLRRKSQPPLQAPAASGDPEALARRRDRPIPRQPRSHRASTSASTTSSSKRTTGKPPRSAPGASAGR